ARVAQCFACGPITVNDIGGEPGRASALKMCFAAYSKGSAALLCAVVAAARGHGVLSDLAREWDRIGPGMESAQGDILRAAPKAWRFAGEMHEIAATLASVGVPGGFHKAAAELYERLSDLKDSEPSFEQVLALLSRSNSG